MISRYAKWALLLAAFLFASCGSKDHQSEAKQADTGAVAKALNREPTKEVFLEDFGHLYDVLVEGKYKESLELVALPRGMSETRALEMMPRLISLLAISRDGIDMLAEKGEYGKAADLFPDTAPDLAKRALVDLDKSWAVSLLPAQVMGSWDGKRFVFFKFDKVGLIAQDPSVIDDAKRILSGKLVRDSGVTGGE